MKEKLTITLHLASGSDQVYKLPARGMKLLLAVIVAWVLLMCAESAQDVYANHRRNADLRPQMVALANAGQQQAALWLVKHYWDSESSRLQTLVDEGMPEAEFMGGLKRVHDGDEKGGNVLIARAASKGYAPAMLAITRLAHS